MSQKFRRQKVIGYKINGLIYPPSEIIILYAPKPPGVIKGIAWYLRRWARVHRKGLLVILLVIAACVLSAVITAHYPT